MDKRVARTRIGTVMILAGVLVILAAGGLYLHIRMEERQAGESAAEVTDLLLNMAQDAPRPEPGSPEGTEGAEEGITPEGEVTAVIDGETYLGVLSFTGYGLELPVLAQWDFEALRQARAVYAGSVAGNDLVIAAHNYRSHFSVLNRMVVGNEVVLTDPAGHAIRYVVRKIEVLQPTAIEEMTAGEWDLTLFTCTYGGKTRQTLRCERMT